MGLNIQPGSTVQGLPINNKGVPHYLLLSRTSKTFSIPGLQSLTPYFSLQTTFYSDPQITIHAQFIQPITSMAEQTLPELWKEAEARFHRITGKPLKLSPPKTLEDVRKEIESQQTEDIVKEDAKTRATKDFSMVALQCLKLLGGVAAQGAALVSLQDLRLERKLLTFPLGFWPC
jgi:hypothetical protein